MLCVGAHDYFARHFSTQGILFLLKKWNQKWWSRMWYGETKKKIYNKIWWWNDDWIYRKNMMSYVRIEFNSHYIDFRREVDSSSIGSTRTKLRPSARSSETKTKKKEHSMSAIDNDIGQRPSYFIFVFFYFYFSSFLSMLFVVVAVWCLFNVRQHIRYFWEPLTHS